MSKVVHAHVFEPHSSVFKRPKSEKAECGKVTCSNSENCGLFARGECAWLMSIGWQACPYGKYSKEEGFSQRSNKYHSWIKEKKEFYSESLNKLKWHSSVMSIVGDYIFLPYSHITMNENIPFLAHGGFLRKENCFLLKSNFTIESIISICQFRPMAMMGGEIVSYQNEVVPLFIKHLSEQMPELYLQLCDKYARAKAVVDTYNYVGRKALLKSITPNIGEFTDIHKGTWKWDGEYLTSLNSRASFMLVDKFSELRLKPSDSCVVKIGCNEQVNANTKFVD